MPHEPWSWTGVSSAAENLASMRVRPSPSVWRIVNVESPPCRLCISATGTKPGLRDSSARRRPTDSRRASSAPPRKTSRARDMKSATTPPASRNLIHGRNAVLEAARAGRVVKVYQAAGAGRRSAIDQGKRAGIGCAALDGRGDTWPWDFDLTQRVCVVVGGEGQGVHRLVLERCDVRLKLPVRGHVSSLNASAAAAALLYEVSRQRAR